MPRRLPAALLALTSLAAAAQDLPPASEFYYCAHLYQWVNGQLTEPSALKDHMADSLNVFQAGAMILSGGAVDRPAHDTAAERLRAEVERARAEGRNVSGLVQAADTECWTLQRRHGEAMLRKGAAVFAAQKAYFTHQMAPGPVPAAEIARRQEFVQAGPGVAVDDQKDAIVYSFSRMVGEARETAYHVFTKDGNPAHPAVIFMSSRRLARDKPAVLLTDGSYAGSRSEFDSLFAAFAMMNRLR